MGWGKIEAGREGCWLFVLFMLFYCTLPYLFGMVESWRTGTDWDEVVAEIIF